MRSARFLYWCVGVFVLSAIAVGGWFWRPGPREVAPQVVGRPAGAEKPSPVSRPLGESDPAEVQPDVRSLAHLQPGTPRTAVERLLGAPVQGTHPVVVKNERVTYCATYRVPLAGPAGRAPRDLHGGAPALTLVTLEFDATKHDHPLIGVPGAVESF